MVVVGVVFVLKTFRLKLERTLCNVTTDIAPTGRNGLCRGHVCSHRAMLVVTVHSGDGMCEDCVVFVKIVHTAF